MTTDDRTDEQRDTHSAIIVGRDTFLSGWGRAEGMDSFAGWACLPEDVQKVREWVEGRSDMEDVQTVDDDWEPEQGALYHIYVVHKNHPATTGR